jgi:hypothetical protein
LIILQVENSNDFVISNRDEHRVLRSLIQTLIAETKILQQNKRQLQQNLDEKRKAVATAKGSEANVKKDLEKVVNGVTKKDEVIL